MRKLLFWLTSHLPCRIIAEEGSVYLERYYLFTLLGWRFYLHRFVGSDPDRGLHDHPWSRAFSIILAGWYWEQTRSGTRKVRWLNTLTGDTFHRVVLPSEGFVRGLPFLHPDFNKDAPCWTLFFHRAKRTKGWGFLREQPGDFDAYVGRLSIFTPYTYTRTDEMPDWWIRVPKGRDEPRRAAP